MPLHRTSQTARTCGLSVIVLAAIAISGCKKAEQIEERTEPIPLSEIPYPDSVEGAKVGLLVAIAPIGREKDQWCFFKFVGPIEEIAKERKNFDQFIGTLDFQPELKIPFFWKVPNAWRWLPGGGFRLATMKTAPLPTEALVDLVDDPVIQMGIRAFQMGYENRFAELSVSKAGGSLLANINRWRNNDLGLPPIAPADLPRVLSYRNLENATLIMVDMAGPGGKKSMMPAFHPPIEQ